KTELSKNMDIQGCNGKQKKAKWNIRSARVVSYVCKGLLHVSWHYNGKNLKSFHTYFITSNLGFREYNNIVLYFDRLLRRNNFLFMTFFQVNTNNMDSLKHDIMYFSLSNYIIIIIPLAWLHREFPLWPVFLGFVKGHNQNFVPVIADGSQRYDNIILYLLINCIDFFSI
ncbi:hypothetical protein ACJX0J_008707, partial [Zea mays]